MNIGNAIRTIRKKYGMTQNQFAGHIGITQTHLSLLEKNKRNPSIDVLERMSQQVFIPLPILLWFSVDEKDVKEGMDESFRIMKPSIDELIYSFFLHED